MTAKSKPEYLKEETTGTQPTLPGYQLPVSEHVKMVGNKPQINFSAEFLKANVVERCKTLKVQKLAAIDVLKKNIEKYTKSGNQFKLKVAEANLEDAYESLRILEQQLA